MAKANLTFGQLVGYYFTDMILPNLRLWDEDEILEAQNQYIADATTDPALIAEIERYYGVSIW